MELLINKALIASQLQVGIGVADAEVKTYIRETQEIDLRERVCEDFYHDLLSNRTADGYKVLFQGGEYTYDSKTYYNPGLNKIIAYWAFARLTERANKISTTHGLVRKNTPQSEALSQSELDRSARLYRNDADRYWEEFKKYMDRNDETFTNWEGEKKSTFKTSVIK